MKVRHGIFMTSEWLNPYASTTPATHSIADSGGGVSPGAALTPPSS